MIVDWAPWHHTAAGNHDFGLVLYNGGSYYIDEGKPMPGAIEATVRNLREIAPTWYFNVPRGYEALLPYLKSDAALRRNFFSRLRVLWFAGAAIAQHVFDEVKALARETRGEPIPFLTGLGATETAPYAMGRMWETARRLQHGPAAARRRDEAGADGREVRSAAEGCRTSRPAIGASPSSRARPSTRKATTASAIRSSSPTRNGPKRAFYSAAASPRTSSSPPAPSSTSARCARGLSSTSRRWCATW